METLETTAHTLTSMAEALPKPNEQLRTALMAGVSEASLVKIGRTIDSSRIVTDAQRLYGLAYAFWMKAGKAQRQTIRGFSEELLALAVDEAVKLAEMKRAFDAAGHHDDEGHARRSAQIVRAHQEAIVLRDQAEHVLRDVAGGDDTLLDEIAQVIGTADDDDALALGLERLAALGERILAAGTPEVKARAQLFSFDVAYVTQLTGAAAALQKASQASGLRFAKPTSQGSLDRADGINLRLLASIVRAFESAHDRDPTIPRLVPIATRRVFSRRTTKGKGEAPVEESGATGDRPTVTP